MRHVYFIWRKHNDTFRQVKRSRAFKEQTRVCRKVNITKINHSKIYSVCRLLLHLLKLPFALVSSAFLVVPRICSVMCSATHHHSCVLGMRIAVRSLSPSEFHCPGLSRFSSSWQTLEFVTVTLLASGMRRSRIRYKRNVVDDTATRRDSSLINAL